MLLLKEYWMPKNYSSDDIIYKTIFGDTKDLLGYIFFEGGKLVYQDINGHRVSFNYNDNDKLFNAIAQQMLLKE